MDSEKYLNKKELLKKLNTSASGLKVSEAGKRINKYGIPTKKTAKDFTKLPTGP